MKSFIVSFAAIAIALAVTVGGVDAEKKADDGAAKVVCPVSGKPINPEATVDYKGGKVAFCCPGCPNAFAKNTAKFAAKANHQLVATGQAKLVKCPVAGRKLNPATKISVAGVNVCFCCNGCKGKATKLEGDEQLEFVFGDKAFEKGFKVVQNDE